MNIEEMVIVKVTPPSKKERKERDFWNHGHKGLADGIERCLATGKEVLLNDLTTIYVIKPEYPLIEEAMAKPENKDYLKVRVSVFHSAFHLGVKSE